MVQMLYIASKQADEVRFSEPLAKFLASEYSDDPGDFSSAVTEISQLRDATCVRAPEQHERGIKAIQR